MPAGIKEIRLTVTQATFNRLVEWKRAWSRELDTDLSWAELVMGLAYDKAHWPKERR